jgi:hypothetical protein
VSTELPRVSERRRAVQLARHYRETEHLSIAEIASRLGRARATVREYLYDPDGSKEREVKARYYGHCSRCGTKTSSPGPGQPKTLCATCNGHASAKWDCPRIEAALRAWHKRHHKPASTTDLSLAYARKRAPHDDGERLRRLQEGWDGGDWPPASVVQYHFGTIKKANEAALNTS